MSGHEPAAITAKGRAMASDADPSGSKPEPAFEIGLALSGAISAGAYTAGVIDFLVQALQAWEDARPDAPRHKVRIRTIAGASAGAITGAIGVVALARGLRPTPLSDDENRRSHRETRERPFQTIRCVLPSLYRTWVTRPRMVAAEQGDVDFLSFEDLQPDSVAGRKNVPAMVQSLMNSRLLDAIRDEAFEPPDEAVPIQPPYPYLAETMHLVMTVSNLRGIPFTVSFGNSSYGMQTHGDRLHYAIRGIGSGDWPKVAWLDAEHPIELDTATLPKTAKATPAAWTDYGTCALASAAFPIGLAPRMISTPFASYANRQYPLNVALNGIKASFPEGNGATYNFLNVDGGVINNNPFDYVQYAIMENRGSVRTEGSTADRSVIMVSPFPEPPTFLPEGSPVADIVSVLKALFPALINQARFRASELGPALDPRDYSRFLIAPHRVLPDDATPDGAKPERQERYAIACGLLGGFGGFLDEQFRAHDYQLGRRNCQRFLRTTFGVSADHPISEPMRGQEAFAIATDPDAALDARCTLVPLVGNAVPEVALPHWPQMSQAAFDHLMDRIGQRLDKAAPIFLKSQTGNRLLRWIAWTGLTVQRGRILSYLRATILADLVRRDQIESWTLPASVVDWAVSQPLPHGGPDKGPDNVRAVVAELVSPAFDCRTIPNVATATHLGSDFVRGTLKRLESVAADAPYRVVGAGRYADQDLFVLASRRPRGVRTWPLVGRVSNWFVAPRIDCA